MTSVREQIAERLGVDEAASTEDAALAQLAASEEATRARAAADEALVQERIRLEGEKAAAETARAREYMRVERALATLCDAAAAAIKADDQIASIATRLKARGGGRARDAIQDRVRARLHDDLGFKDLGPTLGKWGREPLAQATVCGVCAHEHRVEIDAAIEAGEPLRTIANRYGPSSASLSRHNAHMRGAG